MGHDAFSLLAPARVKVVLVPIGGISASRFTSFAARLQHESVVRLGDVSPDGRPHRTMFSPLAFPEGRILYALQPLTPTVQALELEPFEIYQHPLLILGIVDGAEVTDEAGRKELQERSMEELQAICGTALVHCLLLFDVVNVTASASNNPCVFCVPSIEKSRSTTIKTLMCDLTAILLAELTTYAKSLQGLSTLSTPKIAGLVSRGELDVADSQHDLTVEGYTADLDSGRSLSPVSEDRQLHRTSMPVQTTASPDAVDDSVRQQIFRSPSKNQKKASGQADLHEEPSLVPRRAQSQDRASPSRQEKVSTNGFGPSSMGERERNRGKARIGTAIGSLYLLAGRWPDAMLELSRSAAISRSNSDYVWQAKAMDYLTICLVVCAWAGMNFRIPNVLRPAIDQSRPETSKSKKDSAKSSHPDVGLISSSTEENRLATMQSLVDIIPDIITNVVDLYGRAYSFTDDKFSPLIYSQTVVRYSSFLASLLMSNYTLNSSILRDLVEDGAEELQSSPIPVDRKVFLKNDVINLLLQAYPEEGGLTVADRVSVLTAMSGVLLKLGVHRKRAMMLRAIIDTIAPALAQAQKDSAAQMGFHPSAGLKSTEHVLRLKDQEQQLPFVDMSHATILLYLQRACVAFGIPIDQDKRRTQSDVKEGIGQVEVGQTGLSLLLRTLLSKRYGPQHLKIDLIQACITICRTLSDGAGQLHYSATLLRLAGSGMVPARDCNDGAPLISLEEQLKLAADITDIVSAATPPGTVSAESDYWDEFLLRSVEIVPVESTKRLIPHIKSDLDALASIESRKKENPFIYNPFLKSKPGADRLTTIVANEPRVFSLVFQNLFDFDLIIERIVLLADGVDLKSIEESTTIGPYRTQAVLITAVPKSAGSLTIRGCTVKVRGCYERDFSIYTDPWSFRVDVKGRNLCIASGIDGVAKDCISPESRRDQIITSSSSVFPVASNISVEVLQSQPLVILKSTSLTQSTISLSEGEKQTLKVVLENQSAAPVDFLLLSYTDSVSTRAAENLASQEITAGDLYHLEQSLSQEPCLRTSSDMATGDLRIEPLDELTIDVEIYGRKGLSLGTIQIDYAHIESLTDSTNNSFYTRQISFAINISVSPAIALTKVDVLPLKDGSMHSGNEMSMTRKSFSNESETASEQNIMHQADAGHNTRTCWLLLDFHNAGSESLEFSLCDASASGSPSDLYQRLIHPNTTGRVPLPLSCVYIPWHEAQSPIPSFSDTKRRQYVVSSVKSSQEDERFSRELFWYQQALAKRLKATWKVMARDRQGSVSMRAMQLSPSAINMVKLDDIEITMSIQRKDETGRPVTQKSNTNTFRAPTEEFLILRTSLHNRSPLPISPFLRLQPRLANQPPEMVHNLTTHLLVNGVLQRKVPIVQSGATVSSDTTFIILNAGLYEWTAAVDEVAPPNDISHKHGARPRAKTGDMLSLSASQKLRTWAGRTSCFVQACAYGNDSDDEVET